MSTHRRTLATACMLYLVILAGCSSGSRVADIDWLIYDVAQLKAIYTYTLPEVSSLQTGPLVVDDTMYFTTDEGAYAIDASTCVEKWKTASAR